MTLFVAEQFLNDALRYGYHHGCCGCVRHPHTMYKESFRLRKKSLILPQKRRSDHKAEHDPFRLRADNSEHTQCNALVQIALLNGKRYDKASDEEKIQMLQAQ